VEIHEIIANDRKVVKYFKFSSVTNGLPQGKISLELGNNLELILDWKTWWNSLADMIIMFEKLQKFK
jgi:hypothetical protein